MLPSTQDQPPLKHAHYHFCLGGGSWSEIQGPSQISCCTPVTISSSRSRAAPCAVVHEETIKRGGYPSPLNYCGFPKSVCTSINEVTPPLSFLLSPLSSLLSLFPLLCLPSCVLALSSLLPLSPSFLLPPPLSFSLSLNPPQTLTLPYILLPKSLDKGCLPRHPRHQSHSQGGGHHQR
jgi:hypothetical protein